MLISLNVWEIELDDKLVRNVEDYCKFFLHWLANVQENRHTDEVIQLINSDAFSEKIDKSIDIKKEYNAFSKNVGNLIKSDMGLTTNVLDRIWKRMSGSSLRKVQDAQNFGKFLQALYDNCEDKTSKFRS